MRVESWLQGLSYLFMLCGLSFWISILFSPQTPVRMREGWGWLDWRPLPHDMGRVLLLGFLFSFLLQTLTFGLFPALTSAPAFFQVALTLMVYQGAIVWILYRHLNRLQIPESQALGVGGGSRLHDLTWGLVGYCMVLPPVWLCLLLSEGLFQALGWEWTPQQMVQWVSVERSSSQSLALLLLIGFVGPFLEEVIFRGVLFPVMMRKAGPLPGLFLQAGIFAVIHLHAGSMVPLFLLGILLGLIYVYTRRLMSCVWTHAMFNAMTLFYTLPLFTGEVGT